MASTDLRADSARDNPTPSAQSDHAPAIPVFDPSNPAHQRAWQSILSMGQIEAEKRAQEAERVTEPDPEPANVSTALFYAYRRAKAAWELVQYAPEYMGEDVPADINDPLSAAHTEALNAFLITPADELQDRARKLKVFRDEQIHDGWWKAHEIVVSLAADAQRFAYSAATSPECFAAPAY